MSAFVGIDLGTTFSAVATINRNGEAEVLRNLDGELLTPSVIDLSETPPVIGRRAKEKQAAGELRIASFFKTMMGTPDQPFVFGEQEYTPIDLSAMLLNYLKRSAEAVLGQPVTDAVITVPAYFMDTQREATLKAGKQADLNVLRIINEPTSAALAYKTTPGRYLVYDLGGGTFDVSIVQIAENAIQVIATDGEHQLGGRDWDDRILNFLTERFREDFGEALIGDNLNELRIQAENAKKSLSALQSTKITVQGQTGHATYELERNQFNQLTADLMERTRLLTEQALQSAQSGWKNLDGVILVGGSTRMPMVRTYVTQMFGQAPSTNIDPDQAVALGAAIEAGRIMSARGQAKYQLARSVERLSDVTAHSLGMVAESADRSRYVNSILIQRQTALPAHSAPRVYELRVGPNPAQNRLDIFVTQGESSDPLSTRLKFLELRVASAIPHVSGGVAQIEVIYGYNADGIVEVSARELSTGQTLAIHQEPLPPDIPARFGEPPLKHAQSAEPLTIYVAIDLSGSMSGGPLEEAKRAALGFVNELQPGNGTRLGLLSVADRVHVNQAATDQASLMEKAILSMSVGSIVGYGNATHPFGEIHRLLANETGRRFAIVLADGVWSHQDTAVKSAKQCHQAGIEIIGICFGKADQGFMNAISSAGKESLKADYGQLAQAFSTIARELRTTLTLK